MSRAPLFEHIVPNFWLRFSKLFHNISAVAFPSEPVPSWAPSPRCARPCAAHVFRYRFMVRMCLAKSSAHYALGITIHRNNYCCNKSGFFPATGVRTPLFPLPYCLSAFLRNSRKKIGSAQTFAGTVSEVNHGSAFFNKNEDSRI